MQGQILANLAISIGTFYPPFIATVLGIDCCEDRHSTSMASPILLSVSITPLTAPLKSVENLRAISLTLLALSLISYLDTHNLTFLCLTLISILAISPLATCSPHFLNRIRLFPITTHFPTTAFARFNLSGFLYCCFVRALIQNLRLTHIK
ncbi:hypothetical protein SAMN03084138_04442 [Enterovibrio norvegicus DSM 15893]|uniref:Uncharacterized protein n=1 Tax=Enterovibrio norvegicus DSM 15893 TaxID=1121869 RepID=A0A1I5WUB8_9GAMM|nr:hypothetical protein SAMN03084138_04442 [Enterovibrio norvegicus DSM 15893]